MAEDPDGPDIVAVNQKALLALLDTGETIPIELVPVPNEHCPMGYVYVAGPDSQGFWYAIDMSEFQFGYVH